MFLAADVSLPTTRPGLTSAPLLLLLQLLNERLMGAEGTKLDEDFVKMEKVKEFESPRRWGSMGTNTD